MTHYVTQKSHLQIIFNVILSLILTLAGEKTNFESPFMSFSILLWNLLKPLAKFALISYLSVILHVLDFFLC